MGLLGPEFRDIVNAAAIETDRGDCCRGCLSRGCAQVVDGRAGRTAKLGEVELGELAITPAQIGELQALVDAGRINDKLARQVLEGVLNGEGGPEEVLVARGLGVVSDDGPLLAAIDAALAAQPDVAAKVRSGNLGPVGSIIGAVMKSTRGQADAARVRELVLERLAQV